MIAVPETDSDDTLASFRYQVFQLVPETGQSVTLFWCQIFLVRETSAG